jgi:hypothetical protein
LLSALSASLALAAKPGDADALRVLKEAMDDDYLEMRFDEAEQKLRKAIDSCAVKSCEPAVLARLHIAVGSVLAGGKKQLEDAKDAFVQALRIYPSAALDPNLTTSEVTFAYNNARTELKLGQASSANSTSDVDHIPPAEQKKGTPVPLYLTLPDELLKTVSRVTVSYRGPKGTEYKSLVLRKLGENGYGINVPCTDLEHTGKLSYMILVTDKAGAVLSELGSRSTPLTVPIRESIELEPPHWPGFAPPETCRAIEKGPEQCIDNGECNDGLVCNAGRCEPATAGPESPEGARKNWLSLNFAPDISFISGDDVCSKTGQSDGHFACFKSNGDPYRGTPLNGKNKGNNINTGAALSTLRLVLAYDRLILDNFTLGARIGYAFGGASGKGANFLPVHVEARAAYWIGKQPFETHAPVRPFVFLSGGLAQVDTKQADITVTEAHTATDGTQTETREKVVAYKQAGLGFIGAGVGVSYAPTKMLALNVGVRGSVTLPVVTAVISPEAGLAVGF